MVTAGGLYFLSRRSNPRRNRFFFLLIRGLLLIFLLNFIELLFVVFLQVFAKQIFAFVSQIGLMLSKTCRLKFVPVIQRAFRASIFLLKFGDFSKFSSFFSVYLRSLSFCNCVLALLSRKIIANRIRLLFDS